MSLDEIFPLTEEEKNRLARLPGPASTDDWLVTAKSLQRNLIQAYADRAITFRRLMEVVRSTSLGCTTQNRVTLLGVAAETALRTKPSLPLRNGKRPRYPMALKIAAVDMVERIRELSPDANLLPCLELAVQWIEVLRLFTVPPNVRTLNRWYIERRSALGRGTPRGRPRKVKTH